MTAAAAAPQSLVAQLVSAPPLLRKVIKIRAEDSPNVAYAIGQHLRDDTVTGRVVLAGVLTWDEYCYRRKTWDPIRQTVGLDAEFYKGKDVLLYPPEWLLKSALMARMLAAGGRVRQAEAIGIDPAEGGDRTAMAAGDKWGLIELVSKKTPDTNVIVSEALAFMRKHRMDSREKAKKVLFDRGGGGKQHADRLRDMGYPVRTVAFGEAATPEPRRYTPQLKEKVEEREERYVYFNRRAELYGDLRLLLDPSEGLLQFGRSPNHLAGDGFPLVWGIPGPEFGEAYKELHLQLTPVPLRYDSEGRLVLPPKQKRDPKDTRPTLTDLIGHSPDELDAVTLLVHGLLSKGRRVVAGAA